MERQRFIHSLVLFDVVFGFMPRKGVVSCRVHLFAGTGI